MTTREISRQGSRKVCAICLEELHSEEGATGPSCGHVFHGPCLKTWLKRNRVCPLCRHDVSSTSGSSNVTETDVDSYSVSSTSGSPVTESNRNSYLVSSTSRSLNVTESDLDSYLDDFSSDVTLTDDDGSSHHEGSYGADSLNG